MTTIVDAYNGFNELSRLKMMWTVQHCWPAGVKCTFNFYNQLAQILLRQLENQPVALLIRDEATQGDPPLMFRCGITLVPLAKELWAADLGILTPFYADATAFNRLAQGSAQIIKLLMEKGAYRRYFSVPANSLFISDLPYQEESAKTDFVAE